MNTILITGTNRGIGLELTKIFAENNWDVIACCRNPKKADKLTALSKQYKNIMIHKLDVEDFNDIENLKETLKKTKIDILLNNAGIYGGQKGQFFGKIDYKSFYLKIIHFLLIYIKEIF